MIQLHVYFSGIVQGVGFRYTAYRYAVQMGICGWVRNLPDGRVEMKAEAERKVLEQLLKQIRAHFNGSIRDTEIYWDDHVERLNSFEIAF